MSSYTGTRPHSLMRCVVDIIEDRDHYVVVIERGEDKMERIVDKKRFRGITTPNRS